MKRLEEVLTRANEAETPAQAWKKDADDIELYVKQIAKAWANIKKNMEKQLKDEPTSWQGIGRGAEIADMVTQSKELADFMSNYSDSF